MFPLARRITATLLFTVASLGTTLAQVVGANEKPFVTHLVFATVYPSGYSEVWLADSSLSARIVSNIDFRLLEPDTMVETGTATHNFFVISCVLTTADILAEQQLGYFDSRGVPKYWPALLPSVSGSAAYVMISNAPNFGSNPPDFDGTDALHRYFDGNRVQLMQAFQQRLLDAPRIAAEEAARRAATKALSGPQVSIKRVEYGSPTPSSNR